MKSLEELYSTCNQTETLFDDNKLIHQFFEEQVKKNGDQVALSFLGESMSYRELNKRANQLAYKLLELGVSLEQPVGIMVERSFEMIIGIFAIVKAGGAYLPINPQLPKERITYYLENSKTGILLTVRDIEHDNFKGIKICYMDDYEQYSQMSEENPDVNISSDNIAYIIYTSGSTGKPKGVMIEHRSLINRLQWMQKTFQVGSGDVLLQKTSFSFDVSVWEIFLWSMYGAKLVLLKPNKEKDPRAIVKAVRDEKVTMVHFVPSVLEMFLDYIGTKFDLTKLASLKYVVVSGEELSKKTVLFFNELLNPQNTSLWNLYGPTEATIDVTSYCCDNVTEDTIRVPIGKPIDNIQLYILDSDGNRLGVNEIGELCIGGVGVSRGYINNETLTQEQFIDNPYGKGKLYHTGDLACWNENGEVEFHGRMDYQIKLRGLRIELGEIEARMLTHNQIKKAAVIVEEVDLQNKLLVGFYQSDVELDVQELKDYLGTSLPDYMIPTKFIKLEEFPINQNGKLDRRSLIDYTKKGNV